MSSRVRASLTLAVLLAGSAGPAQAQAPARDVTATSTPAVGTGRIRGRVVDAATASPLRRAQVTISGDRGVQRLVTTDGEGRYEISGLPTGGFIVAVSKGGYLTLQYGQRRPFEPGRPVPVAAGQTLEGLDIALPRASAISGRITNRFGEPAIGAEILVERYQYASDGQRRLSRAPGTAVNTNDLGEFRWFGLMPGEYVVSATLRQPIPPTDGGPGQAAGYVQTYNGGTASFAIAQPVTVGLGEGATVQFRLAYGRLARITGTVTDSTGRPAASADVMLTTRSENGRTTGRGGASTAPDGTFSVTNVPPGDHFLQIRVSRRIDGTTEAEHANVHVPIDGQNVDGVQIVTAPPATLAGVVRWEGSSARTTSALQVAAQSVDRKPPLVGSVGISEPGTDGRVRADDTFQLGNVAGLVRLAVTGVPPDWMVKSITAGSANLMTTGANASNISGPVEVVLTDRLARISGVIRDAQGAAAGDALVVLLPGEPMDPAVAQPYVRTVRSNEKGAFELHGLAPGSYVAAALESLEQGYEWDPSFQGFVRKSVRPFRLGEGEALTITLAVLR